MILRTPRFSLRALLAVVLICAIAAWSYWFLWPNWVAYRAGVNFERMAMDLRAGTDTNLFKALPNSGTLQSTQMFDSQGSPVELYPFQFKYAWYCVYLRESPKSANRDPLFARGKRWDEVRVYRIEPPSTGYRATTASGAAKVTKFKPGKPSAEVERDSTEQFWADFYEIATGAETRDLGISYELIHADAISAEMK
jgi:hypothetical protein